MAALIRALRRSGALALLALAGCAQPPRAPLPPEAPPPLPAPPAARYDCDAGPGFSLRVEGDLATLEGLPQGPLTLARDAGGETPQQSVWTRAQWRAEFGLGPDGRGARLHDLQSQQHLHCTRR